MECEIVRYSQRAGDIGKPIRTYMDNVGFRGKGVKRLGKPVRTVLTETLRQRRKAGSNSPWPRKPGWITNCQQIWRPAIRTGERRGGNTPTVLSIVPGNKLCFRFQTGSWTAWYTGRQACNGRYWQATASKPLMT